MNRSARRLTVLVGAIAMLALAFAAAFPVWAQDGGGQGGDTFALEDADTLGSLVNRYSLTGSNLRQFFSLNTDLVLDEGQTITFPAGVTTNMGAGTGGDAGAGAQVTGTPGAGEATGTPEADAGAGVQDGNTYVTQAGDTFGDVLMMMGFQPDVTTGAAGGAGAQTTAVADQTIVDIAAADERFSTLVAAIEAAGLTQTLQGAGPFTVFAPTNDAFAKLPAGTVDNLLLPENRQQLADLLTYHVVPGRVLAADVTTLTEADTVLGQPLQVTSQGGTVMINDAQVVSADIEASNGVIHVIDTVLMPEDAAAQDATGTPAADGEATGTPTAAGSDAGTGTGVDVTGTPTAAGGDAGAGTEVDATGTPTASAAGQAGQAAAEVTDAQLQEFVDLNEDITFTTGQMVMLPQGIAVTGQATSTVGADVTGTPTAGALATGTPTEGDAGGAGAQATATPAAGDAGAGAQATETPAAGDAGAGGQAQTYTVQAGESLTDIAARFGVTVEQLLDANPNLVPAGTVLTIPSAQGNIPQTGNQPGQGSQQGGTTGQTGQGQPQQAGTGQGVTGEGIIQNLPGFGLNIGLEHSDIGPGKGVYIVMPGESISSIARRLGITPDEVRLYNPGLVGDTIYPLQRLIVPAGENPGVWKINTPGLEPVVTNRDNQQAE